MRATPTCLSFIVKIDESLYREYMLMKISVTTHDSYQILPFYYICMTSIISFIATIVVQTFIDSYD